MGVNDIILLLLILCWCAFAVYAMMKKKKREAALAAADVVEGQIRMRSAKNVPGGKVVKSIYFRT